MNARLISKPFGPVIGGPLKKVKVTILDEFCAVCGYHRKYAIRLLNQGAKPRKKTLLRKKAHLRITGTAHCPEAHLVSQSTNWLRQKWFVVPSSYFHRHISGAWIHVHAKVKSVLVNTPASLFLFL